MNVGSEKFLGNKFIQLKDGNDLATPREIAKLGASIGLRQWNQIVQIGISRSGSVGVTATATSDGRIILNGTCTEDTTAYTCLVFGTANRAIGHVYYFGYAPNSSSSTYYMFMYGTDNFYAYSGDGLVKRYENYDANLSVMLGMKAGATFNDFIVYPQVIDLTELFGSGNEPTSVEEFRAIYPQVFYPFCTGLASQHEVDALFTTTFNSNNFLNIIYSGVTLGQYNRITTIGNLVTVHLQFYTENSIPAWTGILQLNDSQFFPKHEAFSSNNNYQMYFAYTGYMQSVGTIPAGTYTLDFVYPRPYDKSFNNL